jgi:hypothetical protein
VGKALDTCSGCILRATTLTCSYKVDSGLSTKTATINLGTVLSEISVTPDIFLYIYIPV